MSATLLNEYGMVWYGMVGLYGFWSFDNSTCKRVLDLLEPGDLRLGQAVIKRVVVVKLGVSN